MKIALIVPYFGKLPNHFQLVLNSCETNKNQYDWLFFIDDYTKYNYPENVKVHYCSFKEIKQYVQSKFGFNISLENPYKFCDYKPAYGYIFEEYIKEYDFWGHCDIDCIYGKFEHFFKEDILKYDKVMRLGHLTLYRNTTEINQRFMNPVQGERRYQNVFQTNEACLFDEDNASGHLCIEDIWREYRYSEYQCDKAIANVWYKGNIFRLLYQIGIRDYEREKKIRAVFYWENGCVIRVFEKDGKLGKREFAYIHLMKRSMKNMVPAQYRGMFKIIPNTFEPIKKVPETLEEFYKEQWRHLNIQYIKMRFNNFKIKMRKLTKGKKY